LILVDLRTFCVIARDAIERRAAVTGSEVVPLPNRIERVRGLALTRRISRGVNIRYAMRGRFGLIGAVT